MKIVLINPPVSLKQIYGKFKYAGGIVPPLGLAYIAGVLEKDNHDVRIIDCNMLINPLDDVLKQVIFFKPDLIGLTGTTNNLYEAKRIAHEIKLRCPNIPIVVCEPHLVEGELESLKDFCFDYGIIGEGEYPMKDLVQRIGG